MRNCLNYISNNAPLFVVGSIIAAACTACLAAVPEVVNVGATLSPFMR